MMRIGKFLIKADFGHLVFVTLMVGFIIWYFFDARSASARISNLLLILPLTLASVILYALLIINEIKVVRVEKDESPELEGRREKNGQQSLLKKWIFAAAMAGFLFLVPILGLEMACFLFMSGTLLLLGSRNWKLLVIYSVIFSMATTYTFSCLLNVPLKSLFF